MVAPNPVQLVRLSPSGPELGQPGQLIGGGAKYAARMWTAQGTGADLIRNPDPAADVPGLEAVAVDMRTGYSYDVEVDAQFFGTTGQPKILLLGSLNSGPYVAVEETLAFSPTGHTGSCRLHVTDLAGGLYDHLKVQVQNLAGSEATCTYLPQLTALKVREYTSV